LCPEILPKGMGLRKSPIVAGFDCRRNPAVSASEADISASKGDVAALTRPTLSLQDRLNRDAARPGSTREPKMEVIRSASRRQ